MLAKAFGAKIASEAISEHLILIKPFPEETIPQTPLPRFDHTVYSFLAVCTPNQMYLPLPMIMLMNTVVSIKNLHFQTHRYGDIVPITAAEKWVATLCMVWGVVLFGYILGGLASLLTNADAQRARYIHRLNTIRYHLVCPITKCAYIICFNLESQKEHTSKMHMRIPYFFE